MEGIDDYGVDSLDSTSQEALIDHFNQDFVLDGMFCICSTVGSNTSQQRMMFLRAFESWSKQLDIDEKGVIN